MVDLTQEQQQALEQGENRLRDTGTGITYVLIKEDVFERLRAFFQEENDGQFARDAYSHGMEVFGRDGWDDPAMDTYNELDPRRR